MMPYGPSLPFLGPRDHSADTRARLDVLTGEVSSGRRADIGRAVASDFSSVSRISHDLRTHDAKGAALSRAGTWLETAQASLSSIKSAADTITDKLAASLTPAGFAALDNLAATARGALFDMTTALGASLGGRPIFANGDPGAGAPIDANVVLAETAALAAGATDLDALLAAFDAYFDPPPGGGVETNAIRPYAADAAAFPLGGGKSLSSPVSLGDSGIRSALKQAALVAALPSAGFSLNEADRSRLTIELPTRSANAADGLTRARSRIGGVEERVARLTTELGERRSRLESRQAEAVAIDPFATATFLQNEMTRLETIFAVTARRARLRLTDYIR